MNSRERIQAALAHREPDAVPIDFNGHRSSGIMAQAYVKLRQKLGLPPSELYVYDFIQQLAMVEDDVLDIVGADVVEVGHDFYKEPSYWQDWNLPDGTPCKIPDFCKPERVGDDWVVYGDEDQVKGRGGGGTHFSSPVPLSAQWQNLDCQAPFSPPLHSSFAEGLVSP